MIMPITYDGNAVQVYEAPAEDQTSNSDIELAATVGPGSPDIPRPGAAEGSEPGQDEQSPAVADSAPVSFSLAELRDLAETEVNLELTDLARLELARLTGSNRADTDRGPDLEDAERAAWLADLARPKQAETGLESAEADAAAGEDAGTGTEPADLVESEPDDARDDPDPSADPGLRADPGIDLDDTETEAETNRAGDDAEPADLAEPEPGLEPEPGEPAALEAGPADIPHESALTATVPFEAVRIARAPVKTGPAESPPDPVYMQVGGALAQLDPTLAASGFGYERYTSLAGPLETPATDGSYRVHYRSIHTDRREWVATRVITLILVALDVRFMYWLIFQSQYPHLHAWLWQTGWHAAATDGYALLRVAMAAGSIVMQTFLLINVLTVSRACLAARDPVPVDPEPNLRVAFLTTIVPDREPLEVAERTLRAACEIVYDGKLDVWLLDEGDSKQAREMCERVGVHHFSRKGRGHLELETGTFASKTKHGNHNRWLWEHAGEYDIVMFVDTDHVPLPIMAERLLGYFRDPEVGFVVAPQFYGNTENRITRWAESAQYLFHSVIQRAGNRRGCAMLVGTNAAVRTSAIKNGYVASITEDMATSLKIHTTKSDVTGRPWRSVYTPDLVAVGEGPSTWTEFFGQQTRWSAGTYDALVRQVWRMFFKLRPGAMLHYLLMLTYYPSVALGWLMGISISACYLGFGISSLRTNEGWWLTYYIDVATVQLMLYRFMRRHNVSPHEPAGSSGVSGMVVSALTAPIYARAMMKVLTGRKLTFNVTAKGTNAAIDQLRTFRYSLMWALVPILVLAIALTRHRPYLMMIGWTAIILAVCVAPVLIWLWDRELDARRARREAAVPPSPAAAHEAHADAHDADAHDAHDADAHDADAHEADAHQASLTSAARY
jgi:cellulose synthase/poly-beta-1,6-N-acetylglucosamine synthase-like glycosyltransferase